MCDKTFTKSKNQIPMLVIGYLADSVPVLGRPAPITIYPPAMCKPDHIFESNCNIDLNSVESFQKFSSVNANLLRKNGKKNCYRFLTENSSESFMVTTINKSSKCEQNSFLNPCSFSMENDGF